MILESVADPDAGKETKKGKSGSKKEKNEKTDLVEKSCERKRKVHQKMEKSCKSK